MSFIFPLGACVWQKLILTRKIYGQEFSDTKPRKRAGTRIRTEKNILQISLWGVCKVLLMLRASIYLSGKIAKLSREKIGKSVVTKSAGTSKLASNEAIKQSKSIINWERGGRLIKTFLRDRGGKGKNNYRARFVRTLFIRGRKYESERVVNLETKTVSSPCTHSSRERRWWGQGWSLSRVKFLCHFPIEIRAPHT